MPSLQTCEAYLVLSKREATGFALFNANRRLVSGVLRPTGLSLLGRTLNAALSNPTPETRAQSAWRVWVHGKNQHTDSWCLLEGPDPYGISAETLSLAAQWLREGRSRNAGVITTGHAFDAREFIDALHDAGVRSEIRNGPL